MNILKKTNPIIMTGLLFSCITQIHSGTNYEGTLRRPPVVFATRLQVIINRFIEQDEEPPATLEITIRRIKDAIINHGAKPGDLNGANENAYHLH